MENREKERSRECVNISGRERITVSSVLNIEAFDGEYVLLSVNDGKIAVEGENLKVTSLSREGGEINIVGKVHGVAFFEKGITRAKKRGLFK